MSTQTTDLFLLKDLESDGPAEDLSQGDRESLQSVAGWIKAFIVKPHAELGRPGAVCPFVPTSVERQELWLAAEQIGDGGAPRIIELIDGYKRRLLDAGRTEGDDVNHNVIVVVFTDLPAERAKGIFDDVLAEIAVPSYVEDGIVFGPFFEGNQATAIYNSGFRPFQSPVPFLFVRHGVVSDWKFFLNQEDWLGHWARRFGESGTRALAEQLRHLPWNARRD
jgi:hypothetical protein